MHPKTDPTQKTIPNAVVTSIRTEQVRIDPRERVNIQPLSFVVSRLVKFPGSIESLIDQLNGRYTATFTRNDYDFPQFCCKGHKRASKAFNCARKQKGVVCEFYAYVPGVGIFTTNNDGWDVVVNYLADYPAIEQLKTMNKIERKAA